MTLPILVIVAIVLGCVLSYFLELWVQREIKRWLD